MGLRYNFASVDELVRFLRNSATDAKLHASQHSERSHRHTEYNSEAAAYERIATMIAASNLTVKP